METKNTAVYLYIIHLILGVYELECVVFAEQVKVRVATAVHPLQIYYLLSIF